MPAAALFAALAILLVACGSEPEAIDPEPVDEGFEDEAPQGDEGPQDGGQTLSGVLGGDAVLEGGCVWIDTDEGRFEVIWPDGYSAEADPVRLARDGEAIAEEGDRLTLEGAVAEDMMTTCQIGPVFQAERVQID